jgi:type II secretion system protein J
VRQGGFTLMEVLLASMAFAVVLTAIHLVFYGAVRLRNKTTLALEAAVPLQQTLAILQHDLANVVLPGGTLFGVFQTTPTTVRTATASALRGQVVGPEFCTATGLLLDEAPWAEVQKVSYFLALPTNNAPGRDLVRSVTRNLLPVVVEQPELQRLLGGVEDLVFQYYDGNQWLPVWEPLTLSSNALPQAVKVQLQLLAEETERAPRTPIELVVPLLVQPASNQVAQATSTGGTGQ